MTAANDPTAPGTAPEPLEAMEALLWRWVEHIDGDGGKGMTRPEWFARVGELTLAEQVTWYGMSTLGSWVHGNLASGTGKAPVYAGFYRSARDDGPAVARVSMVVLPLADPGRIAEADWDDGYGGYEPAPVDGYAVLCGDPFDPASVPGRDAGADLREAERIIAACDAEGRRVSCAEIVTDPARGGNALFFPVEAAERDGYEALEEDGTIVCLAFVAYDF
ncbi:hypothetical protein [Streptomyces sp. NPDC047000]|uniref:hypothetical protein n=1 Tax=Streptomyces sp. NPDC047000 TaxID=3155474 RepID=UPI0033F92B74